MGRLMVVMVVPGGVFDCLYGGVSESDMMIFGEREREKPMEKKG